LISVPGHAQAPKPDSAALAKSGILERLAERSGVYGVPPTAKVPGFIADAGWPQKLQRNRTDDGGRGAALSPARRYNRGPC
jgi:hypothetical protein